MALPRKSALILGAAFAALLTMSEQEHAGKNEILAIANKLPGGTTTDVEVAKTRIAAVNTAALSQAVLDVLNAQINPADSKLNPAIVAGEALKGAGSNAAGIGTQLATDVLANLGNINGTFPKINLNVSSFTGDAAEIAATGTAKNDFAANPAQIPTFAAVMITRAGVADFNAETLKIAEYATKSTTAMGAIFGGRTHNADLDTAQKRIDLAKQGLADKKLTKAAQQISQYVSDDVVDNTEAASFALAVTKGNNNAASTKDNNTKYIVAIATGTATANSSGASGIVDALFDGVTANLNVPAANIPFTFTATVKNSTKMASSVGLVADAEQVQGIGVTLTQRVDLTNTDPATAKTKVVGIKNSKVSAYVKGLVLGLTNRPNSGDTRINGNNTTNRIDEIGEIGAYVLNAVKNLAMFQVDSTANRKSAPKFVTTLLKTLITNSAKVYSDAAAATLGSKKAIQKNIIFQTAVADDASGSIGLTLNALQGQINAMIYNSITTSLIANANKIAGKTLGPTILAALTAGINNGIDPLGSGKPASQVYENGTIPADALDVVALAETDIKSR